MSTYLVKHLTSSKLVIYQAFFTLLDSNISKPGVDPFVPFLETDAAAAFGNRSNLGTLDTKLESAAVTIS